MKVKRIVLWSLLCIAVSVSASIAPVFAPNYGVNFPSSYFASAYNATAIGLDNYITIPDMALVVRAFATSPITSPWGIGFGMWNPDADVNQDGVINVLDLVILAANFGINFNYGTFSTSNGNLPKVKVWPSPQLITINTDGNVFVNIAPGIIGLNLYEFTLSWNPSKLQFVSAEDGGFGFFGGAWIITDPTLGYLYVGGFNFGPSTINGPGSLAKITFHRISSGMSTVVLTSRLLDVQLNAIPHKDINGVVVG